MSKPNNSTVNELPAGVSIFDVITGTVRQQPAPLPPLGEFGRLTLSASARAGLEWQAEANGTFTHTLRAGALAVTAYITVEQCSAAIAVRVEIADRVGSITLARRPDAGQRIARFVEEQANGDSSSCVPEPDEYELIDEMERTLREAIRLGRGVYDLPIDDIEDTCLQIRQGRAGFLATLRVNEANWMMLRLPLHRQAAYEMLASNVHQFLAGYRAARDAA